MIKPIKLLNEPAIRGGQELTTLHMEHKTKLVIEALVEKINELTEKTTKLRGYIGKEGGAATLKKHGKEHFNLLANRGRISRWPDKECTTCGIVYKSHALCQKCFGLIHDGKCDKCGK